MAAQFLFCCGESQRCVRRVCDGLGSVDEGDGPALRTKCVRRNRLDSKRLAQSVDELKMADIAPRNPARLERSRAYFFCQAV